MRILVCIEYGLSAEKVLEQALIFFKNFNSAEIFVYTVIDAQTAASYQLATETLQKEVRELQLLTSKVFGAQQVDFSYEAGNAAQKILSKAESLKCDLLIMGTHGRTGLNKLLLGSVAEKVLREITCSTLIIPIKHKNVNHSS